MREDGWMNWAYRAVFKQTDGGGGGISFNLTANERMYILVGSTGLNDYAAGRDVQAFIQDSTGRYGVANLEETVDNQRTQFPYTGEGIGPVPDGPFEFDKYILLGIGDLLVINALLLVQNEELTVTIRGLIKTTKPTIATTGSGGTVTTTETYNKVI